MIKKKNNLSNIILTKLFFFHRKSTYVNTSVKFEELKNLQLLYPRVRVSMELSMMETTLTIFNLEKVIRIFFIRDC